MAVVIETTLGDITVDLYLDQRPVTCLNFLKLCKMKYYNFNLFHTIRSGFIAQTGDPSGEGSGGQSVWGILEGPEKRFFSGEKRPKIRHSGAGLLSMVCTDDMMVGSQFFLTLAPDLDSLDGTHCVIGEVTEGHEVLTKLNEVICDESHRPYRDVRITHTVVLEDPFNDPPGLRAPSRSPSPNPERLKGGRIAPDEDIDETQGKSTAEIQEMIEEKEAKARATILEIVGDLPDADIAPPENVLFVCKLNPVTTDEDLEIIFSRFGKIVSCEVIRDKKSSNSLQYAFIEFENKKSCEDAYFKMDNVLIDDRRIHVDFSQSVSKMRWLGKGRGVQYFDEDSKNNFRVEDQFRGRHREDKDEGDSQSNGRRKHSSRDREYTSDSRRDKQHDDKRDKERLHKDNREKDRKHRDEREKDRQYRNGREMDKQDKELDKQYKDERQKSTLNRDEKDKGKQYSNDTDKNRQTRNDRETDRQHRDEREKNRQNKDEKKSVRHSRDDGERDRKHKETERHNNYNKELDKQERDDIDRDDMGRDRHNQADRDRQYKGDNDRERQQDKARDRQQRDDRYVDKHHKDNRERSRSRSNANHSNYIGSKNDRGKYSKDIERDTNRSHRHGNDYIENETTDDHTSKSPTRRDKNKSDNKNSRDERKKEQTSNSQTHRDRGQNDESRYKETSRESKMDTYSQDLEPKTPSPIIVDRYNKKSKQKNDKVITNKISNKKGTTTTKKKRKPSTSSDDSSDSSSSSSESSSSSSSSSTTSSSSSSSSSDSSSESSSSSDSENGKKKHVKRNSKQTVKNPKKKV